MEKRTKFLIWYGVLVLIGLAVASAQEGGDGSWDNTQAFTLTAEDLHGPWLRIAPDGKIDSMELRDGKLYVDRQGGEYCNEGGGSTCAVYHPLGYDHCSPFREVYGARDGEIVLLETIQPHIDEARSRQVHWPPEEECEYGEWLWADFEGEDLGWVCHPGSPGDPVTSPGGTP